VQIASLSTEIESNTCYIKSRSPAHVTAKSWKGKETALLEVPFMSCTDSCSFWCRAVLFFMFFRKLPHHHRRLISHHHSNRNSQCQTLR